jgi:hypothetical protein
MHRSACTSVTQHNARFSSVPFLFPSCVMALVETTKHSRQLSEDISSTPIQDEAVKITAPRRRVGEWCRALEQTMTYPVSPLCSSISSTR